MIPFEERFTAWVDGQLKGTELEAFEKELAGRPEAFAERESILRMGSLLREHPTAPPLGNADFFSHQLIQRIQAEMPQEISSVAKPLFAWPFRWMALAGGLSLAVAFGLYETVVPPVSEVPGKSKYFAQVVEAWPSDPSISATTVYASDQDMTVVWLDGLDYVPAAYAQK